MLLECDGKPLRGASPLIQHCAHRARKIGLTFLEGVDDEK